MSITGKRGVTVPALLVYEGEGLTLTCEVRDGTLFRGRASRCEENMNLQLDGVLVTDPSGATRAVERVFIRGSNVVFIIFPDILARAPVFERVRAAAKGKVIAGGLGALRKNAIAARAAQQKPADTGGGGGGGGGGHYAPPALVEPHRMATATITLRHGGRAIALRLYKPVSHEMFLRAVWEEAARDDMSFAAFEQSPPSFQNDED